MAMGQFGTPLGIKDSGWTTRAPGILFMPSRHTFANWQPCWLDQELVHFEKRYDDEEENTLFSSWDELEFG